MKKMRIAVIAAMLLAAALTGCGKNVAVPAVTVTAAPETQAPIESVAPTPTSTPSYSAAPHYQYSGGSSNYESSDDPYNAKGYSGADDFYDDNYDDFDSYEDAETYWEDNAG